MDSLLVLIATGLVGHKYIVRRRTSRSSEPQEPREDDSRDDFRDDDDDADISDTPPDTPPETPPETQTQTPDMNLGRARARISDSKLEPKTPSYRREGDEQTFQEKFFPQDTRATVTQKPWMRAVENSTKIAPRTERESSFPTKEDREDVHKTQVRSKVRDFENQQVLRTIPRSSEKQFEAPVEPVATQNEGGGGLRGQRQMQRYHRFIFNDQPSLETKSGPKGSFINKSTSKSHLDNTKEELLVSHSGAPVAASFKVGKPDASFELEGSNAEAWLIDKHVSASSRAPVEKSTKILPSFSVSHDEIIETFKVGSKSSSSSSQKKTKPSVKTDTKLKDASIVTPMVKGAPGGSRLLPINKTSEVTPKVKNETLLVDASEIERKASSKSSAPGALVVKPAHEHKEAQLAEEDTSERVRGVTIIQKSKSDQTGLLLNEAKSSINEKEFTSQNHTAPQNASLPPHLRVAPTSSLTATSDMTLKDNVVDARGFGKTCKQTTKTSNVPSLGESTNKQNRVNLTDLTTRMASGDALKLLSNPYSRPSSSRLQISV